MTANPDKHDRLLSDFIDAWNAGERPDAAAYLARVSGDERRRLAASIDAFLDIAPEPLFREEAFREVAASEGAARAVEAALGAEAGAEAGAGGGSAGARAGWPALLPTLREQARIRRDELVARLAQALGVTGREEKVAVYYHRMEVGTLPPQGVSDKVLAALARILGVDEERIREAGRATGLGGTPSPGEAFARLGGEGQPSPPEPARAGRPAAERATTEPPDEVDELFTGGEG